MKSEYRVRVANRYIVTRYHENDAGSGVETKGEYDNPDVAFEVGYALASEEARARGLPPGDLGVMFPEPFAGAEESGALRTIGELRAALSAFPDDLTPMSPNPPFTGVKLYPQGSGKVLIAPCDKPDYFAKKRSA